MQITIDIPDVFMNGDNSMIEIRSDNFTYCHLCNSHHGIQSTSLDTAINESLMKHCDIIAEEVITMIKEKLIC